uniref:hypothetical protein n=1 Tax=Flavobacterium sp. TaxID=239 RepID=UPI00404712A1
MGHFLLLLIFLSVFLFPKLVGSFRLEDFLLPFVAVSILCNSSRVDKNIIFLSAIYAAYLLSSTAHFLFDDIYFFIVSLLVSLKELSYIILYVFFMLNIKAIYRYLFFIAEFSWVFIVFGFVSLFIDFSGGLAYGVTYINEVGPSPVSITYFSLFIINYYFLVYTNDSTKINFFAFVKLFCLFTLILFTGSRTALAAVLFFVFLLNFKKIFWFFPFFLIFIPLFLFDFDDHTIFLRAISLLNMFEALESSRFESWHLLYDKFLNGPILVGCGRACAHVNVESPFSITLAGDSQYLVNLVEVGLLGLLFHLILLFLISRKIESRNLPFFLAFLLSVMIWSFNAEFFMISKGAFFFFSISSLLSYRQYCPIKD